MPNDIYDYAVRVWIGLQDYVDPLDVFDVEFKTIQEGYCETCEYTTMGITYRLENEGKYPYMGNEIVMEYVPPADFVREVSDIISEIRREEGTEQPA